jgi:hypothetical protein
MFNFELQPALILCQTAAMVVTPNRIAIPAMRARPNNANA